MNQNRRPVDVGDDRDFEFYRADPADAEMIYRIQKELKFSGDPSLSKSVSWDDFEKGFLVNIDPSPQAVAERIRKAACYYVAVAKGEVVAFAESVSLAQGIDHKELMERHRSMVDFVPKEYFSDRVEPKELLDKKQIARFGWGELSGVTRAFARSGVTTTLVQLSWYDFYRQGNVERLFTETLTFPSFNAPPSRLHTKKFGCIIFCRREQKNVDFGRVKQTIHWNVMDFVPFHKMVQKRKQGKIPSDLSFAEFVNLYEAEMK